MPCLLCYFRLEDVIITFTDLIFFGELPPQSGYLCCVMSGRGLQSTQCGRRL